MRTFTALAFLAALAIPVTASGQQDLADVGKGRQIARTVCADCHLVEEGDESDPKMRAPAFQDVAFEPATTEMRLRAFLRTPHREMPNLVLSRKDTDAIIAYILSLK